MKVCRAAIVSRCGKVFSLERPYRHPDIWLHMDSEGYSPSTQGFILENGEFVDRREAMRVAKRAGQLIRDTGLDELYTEDLW